MYILKVVDFQMDPIYFISTYLSTIKYLSYLHISRAIGNTYEIN